MILRSSWAQAIEDRLTDNNASLDRLLGLKSGPGRPEREAERVIGIVRRMRVMKREGATWPEIQERLADDGVVSADERTLRRWYEDCFVDVAAEEINEQSR